MKTQLSQAIDQELRERGWRSYVDAIEDTRNGAVVLWIGGSGYEVHGLAEAMLMVRSKSRGIL